MLKNARRMLQLTNQLLDFRKIQNNKMTLKIKKLDIVSFTKEIFNSFVPLANHKGINYTFESPLESFHIYADPNKLDTVIYNLLSNAIKFTGTGKNVKLRIDISGQADFIDIMISDEGPGIPQKNLSELFVRYTILSNHELAGTGIGLALSNELVKLHSGQILVNSAVGKGSIFTVRLKKGYSHFSINNDNECEIYENESHIHHSVTEDDKHEEDDLLAADTSEKKLVLVVEDNREILDYICQSLKSFFICIGARNGKEGLHLAKTVNPDVIITDIMMPEMDGVEMTRHLKEDFHTSHIPVIIITSKDGLRDQIEGVETGAEAYIVKPFSMEYLKTVTANLINQRMKAVARFVSGNSRVIELPKVDSKDEEFLRLLVSFIEENYSRDFSIDELATSCRVSRTVLYNKIKGLTAESPIEFIRRIKLNIACRLLDKGCNVSEAAFRTGFSDVKYFSRLYKKQFGYSPSKRKAGVS
jgi:DNA-binding response OmpR family regulator/anti-sigma regulatory factor (Ser/Thr protein kinase)